MFAGTRNRLFSHENSIEREDVIPPLVSLNNAEQTNELTEAEEAIARAKESGIKLTQEECDLITKHVNPLSMTYAIMRTQIMTIYKNDARLTNEILAEAMNHDEPEEFVQMTSLLQACHSDRNNPSRTLNTKKMRDSIMQRKNPLEWARFLIYTHIEELMKLGCKPSKIAGVNQAKYLVDPIGAVCDAKETALEAANYVRLTRLK